LVAPLINRRQVLISTGALATLAAGWGALHRPAAPLDSPFLGRTPRATLTAAFRVLLPADADVDAIIAEVDAFLAGDDPVLGDQLRLALGVLEHTAGVRAFSRMPLERQTDVLRSWQDSGRPLRRQIFQALRKTAVFSLYCDPARWPALGYDGPWVGR
jgi:hypothetical protein